MPKLTDLGITKTESSRWQRLASLSKKQQEDRIEQAKRNAFAAIDGTAKLERIEMRAVDEARVRTLVVRPGRLSSARGRPAMGTTSGFRWPAASSLATQQCRMRNCSRSMSRNGPRTIGQRGYGHDMSLLHLRVQHHSLRPHALLHLPARDFRS